MKFTITTVILLVGIFQVHVMVATVAVSPDTEMTCNSCCQGLAGIPGIPGSNGHNGHNGQGLVGHKGDTGSPGEVGQPGAKGDMGSDGLVGESGTKGDHGLKGEQGVGQPGKQGPQGLSGMNGLNGKGGTPGQSGQTGEAGEPGGKGERGIMGLIGEPGVKGDHGLKGEQGVGQPGKQGPPGRPGVNGLKGEIGTPGGAEQTCQCSTQRFAFTAVRTTDFSNSFGYISLPFEQLLFAEEGTDFNLTTGKFTCTVPGIYVFMFSVEKTLVGSRLYVRLMKNGNTLVTGGVNAGGYHQVSTSAVKPLRSGDQVRLAVQGHVYSSSDHETSFTGFMLYEI